VAEGVVVLLEAVEVEEDERAPVGGGRAGGGLLEVLQERAAIREPAEVVGERLVAAGAQQAQVLAEEHGAARARDEQGGGGEQRGGGVDLAELADDEHGEGDGGEAGGQRQCVAAAVRARAPRGGLPRRGGREGDAERPERVDP
jgi:hypothetical protein